MRFFFTSSAASKLGSGRGRLGEVRAEPGPEPEEAEMELEIDDAVENVRDKISAISSVPSTGIWLLWQDPHRGTKKLTDGRTLRDEGFGAKREEVIYMRVVFKGG